MEIDFERADIVKLQTVLGVISSNWRREGGSLIKQQEDRSLFTWEMQRAAIELRGIV